MSSILRCLCRYYQSSNRMSARVAHSKEVKRTLATRKDWKRQATDTTTTIRLATCLLLSLLPPVSKLKDGTILNNCCWGVGAWATTAQFPILSMEGRSTTASNKVSQVVRRGPEVLLKNKRRQSSYRDFCYLHKKTLD
jgi:hypothetical protein